MSKQRVTAMVTAIILIAVPTLASAQLKSGGVASKSSNSADNRPVKVDQKEMALQLIDRLIRLVDLSERVNIQEVTLGTGNKAFQVMRAGSYDWVIFGVMEWDGSLTLRIVGELPANKPFVSPKMREAVLKGAEALLNTKAMSRPWSISHREFRMHWTVVLDLVPGGAHTSNMATVTKSDSKVTVLSRRRRAAMLSSS